MAGTISGESGVITMVEIGPHAAGDSSALIFAKLTAEDRMTCEYEGLSDDNAMGQVFVTDLTHE